MVFLLWMVFGLFSSLGAMQPEIKGLGEEEAIADVYWVRASDGAKIAIPRGDALRSSVLKGFIESAREVDENSEQNPLPLNFSSVTVNLLKRMLSSQTLWRDILALSPDQFYALYKLAWYLDVDFIDSLNYAVATICVKDPDILKKLTGDIHGQLLAVVNEKSFNKKLFEINSWVSAFSLAKKIVPMKLGQACEIRKSRKVIRNPRCPNETTINYGCRYDASGNNGIKGVSWNSDGTMMIAQVLTENREWQQGVYKFTPGVIDGELIQQFNTRISYPEVSAWSHDDNIIALLESSWGGDNPGEGWGRRYNIIFYKRIPGDDLQWELYREFSFDTTRLITWNADIDLFDFNTQDTVFKILLFANHPQTCSPETLVWQSENFINMLDLSIVFLKPEELSMNQTLLLLVLEELNKTDAGKKRIQGSLSAIRNALQTYNPPEVRQAIAEKYGLGAVQIPAYTAADILRDFPAQRVLPQAAADVKAEHAGAVDDVSRELALLHSSLTALAAAS